MASSVHDFTAKRLSGKEEDLAGYKGKALLIVNVASKCGFTPQYDGLQKLYDANKDKGFEILGFPCNQFGAQEPGDEKEIAKFCAVNYGVTFPMFAKIDVNGENAHPLYKFLKKEKKGLAGTEAIKWNFTKFLVDGDGHVVERFGPQDTPELIGRKLAKIL
ncbi:MAG TPA: glutathione peroxidase [Parvularculaceae bacterium]|nr:glutathione peroxidase [Parvularculaceae bacterium]